MLEYNLVIRNINDSSDSLSLPVIVYDYDSSKKTKAANEAANKKGGQLTDRDKFELAKHYITYRYR